jgi:ribosome biogenesis GTPase
MPQPPDDGVSAVDLETLGWDLEFAERFQLHAEQGLLAARVAVAHNYLYQLAAANGELLAEVSGRLRHQGDIAENTPVVGDWVAIKPSQSEQKATIEAVLPRRTSFSRKAAGETTRRQLVAANIDTIFLVCGLDDDFNVRRIERYLVAIRESGAAPVIVLNKADLCLDLAAAATATAAVAANTPTHVINCLAEDGIGPLKGYLTQGHTIALIGSSGVGKSTIINQLLGVDRQRTAPVRPKDGRGRHTTTQRELIVMPGGGLLIDTPGMRELQLWDSAQALEEAFDDIDGLAASCRFRDCSHGDEPGCAVRAAVDAGQLARRRFENYAALKREGASLQERRDELARSEEQRRTKTVHRAMRSMRHNRLTDKP